MYELLNSFISLLIWVLTLAIVARSLMSFISPMGNDHFSAILGQITEPILAPIRNLLPKNSPLDFSPFIAIILLQLVGRLIGGTA